MSLPLKWWMKIPAKMILSRLPVDYSLFRSLSMFKHGYMINPDYAYTVAKQHRDWAQPWLEEDFTVLELGPGDSLLSALNMTALGAGKCYLVDVAQFATMETEVYKNALSYLEEQQGYTLDQINHNAKTVDEFFQNINMEYLTNGLSSLRSIPDNSVDFIWSHAVLEHVRLAEFNEVMQEFHRILKPGGVSSHVVDLKDHMEESLNNLRFSEKTWESDLFSKSGFYTNRLRHNEIIKSFQDAGFNIHSDKTYAWDKLPVAKPSLDKSYQEYPDDDLLVYEFDVILTKEPAVQQEAA